MKISINSVIVFSVIAAAVGLMGFVYLNGAGLEIHNPAVLICASLFVGIRTGSRDFILLQKAACFYFIGVFANLGGFERIEAGIFCGDVTMSYSVIVVILWTIAFSAGRFEVETFTKSNVKNFCIVILAPMIIIAGHMLVLYPLLARFYGYGFEHNWGTLKSISLFVLLFIFSWRMLDNLALRRMIMMIVIITLLLSILWGRKV